MSIDKTNPENKKNNSEESKVRLAVIVCGSFVLNVCSWGLAQSFGVLYIELLEQFGGTKDETAWIQSLFSGIMLVAGPFAGAILKRFGCRKASILGSLLLSLGLFTSVFTPSLQILYVTYGFIGGIGGSLLFTASSVVVLEHFDKRASLAIGIAGSGASAGTIVIPLLSHACIDAYGFRGAFLIMSGVGLQCLIASLTFTPPPFRYQFEAEIEVNTELKDTVPAKIEVNTELKDTGPAKTEVKTELKDAVPENAEINAEIIFQESENKPKPAITNFCKTQFSFINAGYLAFAISWAIEMLVFLVPFLYLPDVALERGVTKQEAAFIASAMGVGSLAGRAGFGFLGDLKSLETSLIHTVPIVIFGALSLVFNFVRGFTNFLILSILIGLLSAIFDGIHPVITFQLVGASNISVGLGVLYFLMSVSTMLGMPVAGWIYESAGRYDEALYYCAGLSFLAAAVAVYIPFWKRKQSKTLT